MNDSYWPSEEVKSLALTMTDAIDGAGWALGLSDDEYALLAQAVIGAGWRLSVPREAVPTRLCDGCNIREPFEHRCHGFDVCPCKECHHPEYEEAERWPDGGLVIHDEDLEPGDFA